MRRAYRADWHRFLFFLEDSGYHDVCDLTDTAPIRDFIIREAPKHSGNRVNLTWPIKKFMRFLLDTGKVSFDVSPMFMNPVPNRKKVLPCFEDEELNALFGAVDTSSAIGKRDLAIMKLALSTGIRSMDLRSLKLDDIDWHRNEIRGRLHTECKTKVRFPICFSESQKTIRKACRKC